MSGRVSKRRALSSKTSACLLLAKQIFAEGAEVMPCQYCFRHQKVCKMSPGSSRCAECVRRGRSCSSTSVATSRVCAPPLLVVLLLISFL
jgi:hypothetical protein